MFIDVLVVVQDAMMDEREQRGPGDRDAVFYMANRRTECPQARHDDRQYEMLYAEVVYLWDFMVLVQGNQAWWKAVRINSRCSRPSYSYRCGSGAVLGRLSEFLHLKDSMLRFLVKLSNAHILAIQSRRRTLINYVVLVNPSYGLT